MSRRLSLVLCLLLYAVGRAQPPAAKADRTDAHGDPLPADALARLGTTRYRSGVYLNSASLSPDGTTLAIATGNKAIRLLDIATGKESRQIALAQYGLTQLSYTADGKGFVVRGSDAQVQLLDLDGKVVATCNTGQQRFGGVFVVSADGSVVACGAQNFAREKGKPSAWDVKTGKQLGAFETIAEQDVRVALSGDGKVLATWGRSAPRPRVPVPPEDMNTNQTVQLWDTTTGKELKRLIGDTTGLPIAGVAVSSDGKRIAVAHGQATVTLWDAGGKPLRTVAGLRGIGTSMTFSPDGKTLVAATPEGTTVMWETATGKRLGVCEAPDCRLLGVVFPAKKPPLAYGAVGHAVRVWELPGGELRTPQGGHEGLVAALAFTADGKSIWSGGSDGRLLRWELATGREQRQVLLRDDTDPRGLARNVRPVFAPDGRHVLGLGSVMRLWELGPGRAVCDFDSRTLGQQSANVAFSPDGSLLVVGSGAFRVETLPTPLRVWDLASGQAVRELHGLRGTVRQVVFSADGKRIAATSYYNERAPGADGQPSEVGVWNAATGKLIGQFERKQGGHPWIAFTPDGTRVAVAGQDRTLRLFEAEGGKELRTIEVDFQYAPQPVIFSPDGRTLAVATTSAPVGGGLEMQVRLFEAATGQLRATLDGHHGPITALAFSRDGRVLATGGNDTTVMLWDLTGKLRQDREGPLAGKWAEQAWEELDSPQAQKAYRALQRLALAPDDSLPLLKKHLTPAEAGDSGENDIDRLIRELDADEFAVRQKASEDLAKLGGAARPALEKAMKNDPTAEVKRRIEELLEKLTPMTPTTPVVEKMRSRRALEVLERIGTPEARKLVETLAAGKAGVPLTEEAKATLARMTPAP